MADFINSAGNVCLRRGSGKQYSLQRAVAQLGSALEWGSRGRGFKSRRPEKFLSHGLTRMKHRLCVVKIQICPCKSVFICGWMLSAGIVGLPKVGHSTLFTS